MGIAVYSKFPINGVPNLFLKHPTKGSFTTEFWYKDDGSIKYDPPENEEEWKFAMLFTKSSFYRELGRTLAGVAISVSSLGAGFQLAFTCAWHIYDEIAELRMAFAALLFTKFLVLIISALSCTRQRLAADPGDVIYRSTRWEYLERMLCTTFFNMLNVPADLTDFPILAHVRKPVQVRVSFWSNQCARAWICGWLRRSQHHVQTQNYSLRNLVLSIAFDMPLVVLKLMLLRRTNWSVDVIMALMWSMLSSVLNIRKLVSMLRHRKAYYKALTGEAAMLEHRLREDPEDWDILMRARIVHKEPYLYFGRPLPEGYRMHREERRCFRRRCCWGRPPAAQAAPVAADVEVGRAPLVNAQGVRAEGLQASLLTGAPAEPAVADVAGRREGLQASLLTRAPAEPAVADVAGRREGLQASLLTGAPAVPALADVEGRREGLQASLLTGAPAVPALADVEGRREGTQASLLTGAPAEPAAADVEGRREGLQASLLTGAPAVPAAADVEGRRELSVSESHDSSAIVSTSGSPHS